MAKPTTPRAPAPPAQPESVETMPPPAKALFHFGALLMRVADNGAVVADISTGYNSAYSEPEARAEFTEAVRTAFPGCSITKISGGEIVFAGPGE
jgi:hypothetical protein